MSDKIILTRNQLAKFLPNPETIKAFENLFKLATQLNPSDITTLTKLFEEASIDSNSALSSINALEGRFNYNKQKFLMVTSNTLVRSGNYCILANAIAGSISITLPLASSSLHFIIGVTKIDASSNQVTIIGTGTNTICGSASQALLYQNEVLNFVSDGTNWQLAN